MDKEVFVKFWKSESGFQIWTPDTDCVLSVPFVCSSSVHAASTHLSYDVSK